MIHEMIDDFKMGPFVAAWPISRDFTAKPCPGGSYDYFFS